MMADLKLVGRQVSEALERENVHKASFVVKTTEKQEFTAEHGVFNLLRTLYDHELALTVYQNQRQGSIISNQLDQSSIEKAVKGALAAAESAPQDEAYDIAPKQENETFRYGAYEADQEKLFARCQELLENIKGQYPMIQVNQLTAFHEKINELYVNTNGTEYEIYHGKYAVMIEFVAQDGGRTTALNGAWMDTASLDRPLIEEPAIRRQLDSAQAQLQVVQIDEKFTGPIILTPDCLLMFVEFIKQNFLDDNAILNQTSLWLDKKNKQVVDPRLTISVNPLDPDIVCGERYTKDGFKSENYDLIQNGILKSFNLSLFVSNKTGEERAGNTSSTVVIKEGDTSYEDMIKQMKKGLVVGYFAGGQPSTSGEFSGVAKNSFYVENGEIKGAVEETMINGNLAEIFNHVVAISKETICDGCNVVPYIEVDGVVISGK